MYLRATKEPRYETAECLCVSGWSLATAVQKSDLFKRVYSCAFMHVDEYSCVLVLKAANLK